MIEFANAVDGTPVENWVGESSTVAFSRGNVGFFAMGNLGREFTTGLPDGDYCDLISECQQTIKVSIDRYSENFVFPLSSEYLLYSSL